MQARWLLLTYMAWCFYSLAKTISHMHNTASSQRCVIHLLAEDLFASGNLSNQHFPLARIVYQCRSLRPVIAISHRHLSGWLHPSDPSLSTPHLPAPSALFWEVPAEWMTESTSFPANGTLLSTLTQRCLLSSQGLQIFPPKSSSFQSEIAGMPSLTPSLSYAATAALWANMPPIFTCDRLQPAFSRLLMQSGLRVDTGASRGCSAEACPRRPHASLVRRAQRCVPLADKSRAVDRWLWHWAVFGVEWGSMWRPGGRAAGGEDRAVFWGSQSCYLLPNDFSLLNFEKWVTQVGLVLWDLIVNQFINALVFIR